MDRRADREEMPRFNRSGLRAIDQSIVVNVVLILYIIFKHLQKLVLGKANAFGNSSEVGWCLNEVVKIVDETPTTIVLINLMNEKHPHLEIVFSTQGVYNTPKLVLRLLNIIDQK